MKRPFGISVLRVALFVFAVWTVPAPATAEEGEDVQVAARLLGVDLNRTDTVTEAQRKYANGIADDLVCLCGTCPREPLSTCDCSWAGKGRKTIQLALLDGKSDEAVLDAYRKAYGDKVFAAPPSEVVLFITTASYAAGALALVGLVLFGLRDRRRQSGAAPATAPTVRSESEDPEAARILRRELEEMD